MGSRSTTRTTRKTLRPLEQLEDRSTPDASLALSVTPAALWEYSGTAAATGTVTRDGFDNSQALTVFLSSSDTTEVSVPSSVVIPAGQTSANFSINAVDDSTVDGTQSAIITATATAPGVRIRVIDPAGRKPMPGMSAPSFSQSSRDRIAAASSPRARAQTASRSS